MVSVVSSLSHEVPLMTAREPQGQSWDIPADEGSRSSIKDL